MKEYFPVMSHNNNTNKNMKEPRPFPRPSATRWHQECTLPSPVFPGPLGETAGIQPSPSLLQNQRPQHSRPPRLHGPWGAPVKAGISAFSRVLGVIGCGGFCHAACHTHPPFTTCGPGITPIWVLERKASKVGGSYFD